MFKRFKLFNPIKLGGWGSESMYSLKKALRIGIGLKFIYIAQFLQGQLIEKKLFTNHFNGLGATML